MKVTDELLNEVIDVLDDIYVDDRVKETQYDKIQGIITELKAVRYKRLDSKNKNLKAKDKLDCIFQKQKEIIVKLKEKFPEPERELNSNDLIDHMASELLELKDCFPWKKWKENYNDPKHIDFINMRIEIVDLLHLLIEFSILFADMNADILYGTYLTKHKENIKRYEGGY